MDVRKYEALTMNDAVKLIKKELGRDAVILATREKEKILPGTNNRTKIVEVLATSASSTSQTNTSQGENEAQNKKVQPVIFPRLSKESDMKIIRGSPTISAFKNENKTFSQPVQKAFSQPVTQAFSQPVPKAFSQPLTQAFSQPVQRPIVDRQIQEANQANSKEVNTLRDELVKVRREIESLPSSSINNEMQEIKILLHDLMKQKYTNEIKKYPDYLTNIAIKMRAAGVLESLLVEFLDNIHGIPLPKIGDNTEQSPEKIKEFYLNNFIRLVFKHLSVTGPLDKRARQTVHCLIGPTGVGKTTTIAKLATSLKLDKGAKVALISMDSYRIAASEQLRTYAKILDVPFAEIHDASEIVPFLQKRSECDAIFIDTAGRVAKDIPHIEELKSIGNIEAPISFHLALSSTMKQRDIDETVRAFKILNIESLIFTKLDESWNFGEILNTAVRSRIPLSYFATGQRVPEDLEIATKEKIVERLFHL